MAAVADLRFVNEGGGGQVLKALGVSRRPLDPPVAVILSSRLFCVC